MKTFRSYPAVILTAILAYLIPGTGTGSAGVIHSNEFYTIRSCSECPPDVDRLCAIASQDAGDQRECHEHDLAAKDACEALCGDIGGGGGGGLSQEQLDALEAVLRILDEIRTSHLSGAEKLAKINQLHDRLYQLLLTINDSLGRISGAVDQIADSFDLVKKIAGKGGDLNAKGQELIERRIAMALLQRSYVAGLNRNAQGATAGDPVLVASGFETYRVEDFSYNAIHDPISVTRQFRSNRTDLDSSFGTSWFFNYDTRIIAGRTPLIREEEILAEKLKTEAARLGAQGAEALARAFSAAEIIARETEKAREAAAAITQLKKEISEYRAELDRLARAGRTRAAVAEDKAAIAGTPEALDNAREAAGLAGKIETAAGAAAEKEEESAIAADKAAAMADQASSAVTEGESTISGIRKYIAEIEDIIAERRSQAEKAAARARLEEQLYPDDPYPEDPGVYFGADYVKLITEDGTPVLFAKSEDEDTVYLPVTDNGSYTEKIDKDEELFILTSKNGDSREFGHDGTGFFHLVRSSDTNGNTIRFDRDGTRLVKITDAVGRQLTFAYNDQGLISEINDPENNSHRYSYQDGRLTGYTDPAGGVWSYEYDGQARLTGRIDPLGNRYSYFYDEQDRVVREVDREGFAYHYDYDPENRHTRVTDRNGNTTNYFYNENHRLERIVHPDSSEVAYSYDGRNNVVAIRDENGTVSYLTYNEFNDPTSYTNGAGERTVLTYEKNFNKIATVTNPLGATTSFFYDSSGNLTTTVNPDGTTRTASYNDLGLVLTVTDENGNSTAYLYDDYGNPATIINPDDSERIISCDVVGRVLAVTDELGNTTRFSYDGLGSLVKRVDPESAVTRFIYDPLKRKIKKIDALGSETVYEYSKRGNLLIETDPVGNSVSYRYDGEENVAARTFANETGFTYRYDTRNRLIQKTSVPGGLVTLLSYDAKGRQVEKQDANNNSTLYGYDSADRKTSVTNSLGVTTLAQYDAAGNLLRVIDGNTNSITYLYDSRNRLTAQTNGIGKTTGYVYDEAGNLVTRANPDGSEVRYLYDSRNRLTGVAYPDGDFKSFTYDTAGNLVRMANDTAEESREYDSRGMLLAVKDTFGGRIDYRYDLLGNRTAMVDPDGGQYSYLYDEKSRLVEFIDPNDEKTTYGYDSMGRVVRTEFGNGTATDFVYDSNNNLSSQSTQRGRQQIASFEYTYDNVGNKLSMKEEDGLTTSYEYDAAYQLIRVNYPKRDNLRVVGLKEKQAGNSPQENRTFAHYTYDGAGNRLTMVDDFTSESYSYNAANQMVRGACTEFGYDENGNRISKTDDSGTTYYQYNADNLLVTVEDPEGYVTGYGYDTIGRRVYKQEERLPHQGKGHGQGDGKHQGKHGNMAKKVKSTDYIYDGLEVLQEITGSGSQQITTYHRAMGRIVSRQDYTTGDSGQHHVNRPRGQRLYYAYDGLGSVVALTAHNGRQKTRYRYDAFGELISGDITDNRFTFTGKQLDPESGLYHFHFRQYDPSAGVWTSEDPIGIIGGNNLYSYVRNNPVNRVDSLGLFEDSGFDDMGDVDDFGEQVDRADYSHPGTELGARERDVDDFGERQDRKDYVDPDSILANRNSTFDDLFRCILPALGKISIKVGKLTYYTIQAITGAFLSRNPLSGVEALAEWEITVQELTEISKNTRDCCQKK